MVTAQRQLPEELGEGNAVGLEPRDQSLELLWGKDEDLSFSLPRKVAYSVLTGPFEVRLL